MFFSGSEKFSISSKDTALFNKSPWLTIVITALGVASLTGCTEENSVWLRGMVIEFGQGIKRKPDTVDSIKVFRAQIEFETGTIEHSKTDDNVKVSFNQIAENATWLDYGRNNFRYRRCFCMLYGMVDDVHGQYYDESRLV